ncbi:flagellar basal body-associated FliL family protein [Opitutaceae bacterium TAV4]|nr:flagellar basal body-associated FliL family protein [Opitutaceae bacterium TAV4]RRK02613.1 flagellar basal body-associated FliL family protein [Opitutaceae bacterium TAV3]
MAAKTETSAAAPAPDSDHKAGTRLPLKAWLPAILAILLTPVATLAVVQFVVVPQLQKSLLAVAASPGPGGGSTSVRAGSAPGAASASPTGGPGNVTASDAGSFKFEDVVVNLAGSMGTRYLKVSFIATGADKTLAAEFAQRKAQLLDVTINVLSSLSLADLEEAGARNLLRERLVSSYNQTLGRRIAEQVYFTDFVVQ